MKETTPVLLDLPPPNQGAWAWGIRRLYRKGRATTRGAPVAGRNLSTGFPVHYTDDGKNVREGPMGTSIYVRDDAPDDDPVGDCPTMFDYTLLEELLGADRAYRAALQAAVKAGMTPSSMAKLEAALLVVVDGPLIERFLEFAERLVPLLARAAALQATHAQAPASRPLEVPA